MPFSTTNTNVCKPIENKLLENPVTIGDKLKNRRLELGILQKDVAKLIGICEDSITNWENNRSEPYVKHYPKIIQFLGYVPFEVDDTTLGGKIRLYRYLNGLSQEGLAIQLGINESTVFQYEKNKHMPSIKTLKIIESLLFP